MKTTTKRDLIDRTAESTGTRQTLVKAVVQEFFQEITSELAQPRFPRQPFGALIGGARGRKHLKNRPALSKSG